MNRNKILKIFGLWLCLMAMVMPALAQKFLNLTSQEVKVGFRKCLKFVYSFPCKELIKTLFIRVEKYPECGYAGYRYCKL